MDRDTGRCMADAALIGMAYALVRYEPELIEIITPMTMLMVMGSVFVFGVVITFMCAYISINKYLRMKLVRCITFNNKRIWIDKNSPLIKLILYCLP